MWHFLPYLLVSMAFLSVPVAGHAEPCYYIPARTCTNVLVVYSSSPLETLPDRSLIVPSVSEEPTGIIEVVMGDSILKADISGAEDSISCREGIRDLLVFSTEGRNLFATIESRLLQEVLRLLGEKNEAELPGYVTCKESPDAMGHTRIMTSLDIESMRTVVDRYRERGRRIIFVPIDELNPLSHDVYSSDNN